MISKDHKKTFLSFLFLFLALATQLSHAAPTLEICGDGNVGVCHTDTGGFCPSGTSHVWGGNDCSNGEHRCCALQATENASCGSEGKGTCKEISWGMCPSGWSAFSGGTDCSGLSLKCCKADGTTEVTETKTYKPRVNPNTGQPMTTTTNTGSTGAVAPSPVITTSNPRPQAPVSKPSGSTCQGGTVFCGPGIVSGADMVSNSLDSGVSKDKDLRSKIIDWTTYLYPIAAILAVVAVVYAGFLYITAFGEEGKVESAKKILMWVVIGIIMILGAFAIVNSLIQGVFA